ncbi:MAG: hypothetical protein KGD63_03975 [Candidatus Lokiarchaeota archaeon]|nr:hypothetical protein [Candidatus Lokiarchaeota archaeon]
MGNAKVQLEEKIVSGQFIDINGEEFYQIKNYDCMPPFFMSLASDSDHWMYISSTGGLTAGRKNPNSALFPYYTDDKIHESAETTGSVTILQICKEGRNYLWEPFSIRHEGIYKIERNIYKNIVGNKIIFEEKNLDLEFTFRYCWMNAELFGWIKKSALINHSIVERDVKILDGLQNILPYGVEYNIQNRFSTLLDAYKKTELLRDSSIVLFRLESIPIDKAEPNEALKVTTVWNFGLDNPLYLVSSNQLDNFRKGKKILEEKEAKGIKGAIFAVSELLINNNEHKEWYFIAELNQDSTKVINLINYISNSKNLEKLIEDNCYLGTKSLISLVGKADGIQYSADKYIKSRHLSNVLFNIMRGGIFDEGYNIDINDFNKHIKHFNVKIWQKFKVFLKNLPTCLNYSNLNVLIINQNNNDLYRLFLEYLPLSFSRRHGDPSRPWNLFAINLKDNNGDKRLYYQGNWRDIFQNWEALSLSFPIYINGLIAKFLNATTADGYNPYYISRDGIKWEIPDKDNPWSNIGYWGDHQIIYLLKLMEISHKYFPKQLISWLEKDLFSFANVPYRIKSYEEIIKDPHNTIELDEELDKIIEDLVKTFGADAKLLLDESGDVIKVNFTEKILVSLLAKLSNFIPEAGIWMNTLRPEWNDANNALVGYGTSMVTVYYMYRYLNFIEKLFKSSGTDNFIISVEINEFFSEIFNIFKKSFLLLSQGFNDYQRKEITDQLGTSGSKYREKIYIGFSGKKNQVNKKNILDFLKLTKSYVYQSISINKRKDGLYNSYNLIDISNDCIGIRYLYNMLEGQVALISSNTFSADEILELLDILKKSALYRPDQESYFLYPNKELPVFLEKNIIPSKYVEESKILKKLIEIEDKTIISKDIIYQYHFNGSFNNVNYLKKALNKIKDEKILDYTKEDYKMVLDIYEKIFNHKSYTGRSGTFYKYEGLGSTYWHMVSKLLLAIGENIQWNYENGTKNDVLKNLIQHYFDIKRGIGAHKSPKEYGSFPFIPYSHTPLMGGVQQPGMTGQVKEDIISRFLELGVFVREGQISFHPIILKKSEFNEPGMFISEKYNIPYLGFTLCNILVLYLIDDLQGLELEIDNGNTIKFDGYTLSKESSLMIFNRDKKINKVIVHLNNTDLL